MDVVELTRALIAIDSINPFRAERHGDHWHIDGNEAEILDFCDDFLKNAGFRTWRQDCGGGRQNLLAEKGTGSRSFLLYSHVDTVEVKEGWSYEEALTPKLGTLDVDGEEQEVLYGLGSNDMKGGLAVILQAAASAQMQHSKLKVALGCDEEFLSLGSHCLVHETSFLDDVEAILVPEVGEAIAEGPRDAWLVTLGRCGRTELVIDVPGTGGHGAEPDRSGRVNAVTQAAVLAQAIELYSQAMPSYHPFPSSPQEIRSSALVTRIEGGDGVLSIPDSARLIVNRVLTPMETPELALQHMEALISQLAESGTLRPVHRDDQTLWPTVTVRERPTPLLRPYQISLEEVFVQQVLEAVAEHGEFQLGLGLSVADENRFAAEAFLPVVVIGPRGEDCHAPWEWVTTKSLYGLQGIYEDVLKRMDAFWKE